MNTPPRSPLEAHKWWAENHQCQYRPDRCAHPVRRRLAVWQCRRRTCAGPGKIYCGQHGEMVKRAQNV